MSSAVARLVSFFRAGYAAGAPRAGHIPLLALARRRLTDDEVSELAAGFLRTSTTPLAGTDIRVAISTIIDDLPSPQDTLRVTRQLVAAGCPVIDPLSG
ncbi:DUF3349 domain-containing protein [Mycolicibacterium sp. Dal123E01]|uniref:DUF3349 domain-containing protein n=1 Tax=Mycolicibacterium sp. Dal123E01 TaxID=3457578 RepID=UPI00403EEB08